MTTELGQHNPTERPAAATGAADPAAGPLDPSLSAALERELGSVAVENGNTNAKAGVLLTLDGILVAGVAALGKVPAPAFALVLVGTLATVASAVLAVLAVKPKLKSGSGVPYGFPRWAACADKAELLRALGQETRPQRLMDLSELCQRKMLLLAASATFGVVAIVAISAASVTAAL